jgi:ComF family protein
MNLRIIWHHSRTARQQFLDIVFPVHCAGCQSSGHVLCPTCIDKIQPFPSLFCQRCSTPLFPDSTCQSCQYHPLKLSGQRAVSTYQEPLRTCIRALKYYGNTRLAEPLGLLLAEAYIHYGIQADIMIPVPLHSERQRQRGYNHASLLAEVCSARSGIPLHKDVLVRHRATAAQVDLNPKDRYQNVAGAFRCTAAFATGALYRRRIVIIDDVSTTGATLEACAAPLFAAGAEAVWGLVLARPIV